MAKIYKFNLPTTNKNEAIHLLAGSRILGVKVQAGRPVLYCEVPDVSINAIQVVLIICAVMTGQDIPVNAGPYIGTALLNDESFVLHYFGAIPEVFHV